MNAVDNFVLCSNIMLKGGEKKRASVKYINSHTVWAAYYSLIHASFW